ncbi:MAG TPA: saccharopine dehydrogenase NADP-binding domain-containing protein [Caulobacteraceae bacterium]|jgi:saccharopine dehydrogenase (NAD+, L-lysine-forming)
MTGRVLVYGVTGHAGNVIARRLIEDGVDVVVAGRDVARTAAAAEALGRPGRAFPLTSDTVIDEALADIDIVLHAAGPFVETASPMMSACIRTRTHYLDLTGEWPVFTEAQELSAAAARAGVMLVPGAGFTLVASDCLLAHAAEARPDSVKLRLAVSRPDAVTRATIRSLASLIGPHIFVRRHGRLVPEPVGRLRRDIDFGEGLRETTAVCWPDITTAEFSTGVANIETFAESDWLQRIAHRLSASTGAMIGERARRTSSTILSLAWPERPPRASNRNGFVLVVEAVDRWRRATTFRMRTGDGYAVTVATACGMIRRTLAGDWSPGFRTPASLYGSRFITDIGCAELEEFRDLTISVS